MRYIIFITFLFIFKCNLSAQILQTLNELNYVNELPENLLNSKTLVLVKVPLASQNPPKRADISKFAEQVQPGLAKAGIDAVVYYYIDDAFSGAEPTKAFVTKLWGRGLENIIFALKDAGGGYTLIITELADENSLINPGQKAWKISGKDLGGMLHSIYLKAASSGQQKKNLLILEVPSYGDMPDFIEGRRGEYFDVNFSSEKLAVPAFADSAQIARAMQNYPYEYGLVGPGIPEKELRQNGYQYILYYVHTTARRVKEALGYEVNNSETVYVSEYFINGEPQVKSIDANTNVYKFYIKHIYSGNTFLGTKWDADVAWPQALQHFNSNLADQLVKD